MYEKITPLLRWDKHGIILLQGPLKGTNLSTHLEKDHIIDYLEDLYYESDMYNRKAIKEALQELKST